ncbi:MAG TPA: DUF1257 domain-containing protein [Anaeromyxobacteraceae bacterium]|nr:DUF1257 domain-containing protein [Anaeromyxobacteraceae bacterium]
MSQGVEIVVLVQGLAALFEAVAEAGAQYRRQRKQLQGADGTVHEVDYVVTDQAGAEVGVKVGAGEKVTLVAHGAAGSALAGKVVQRYAYSKVTGELKAKGYQISKEEKQPDGTVKVVLQRWR